MKSIKIVFCTCILFLFVSLSIYSQPLPPGGGHGISGDQPPGGGAPIASGLAILIGLGGTYAYKKIYDLIS